MSDSHRGPCSRPSRYATDPVTYCRVDDERVRIVVTIHGIDHILSVEEARQLHHDMFASLTAAMVATAKREAPRG